MANETILTAEGVRELEERLEYMKTVTRKEIAEQIKEARGFGDLSENAEYDEAKNEQSRIEGEIKQLEERLRNATIIDESVLNTKTVSIGSTVVVQEQGNSEKMTYVIVGSTEANPLEGKISNESPVGQALIGHNKGDKVEVTTPGGAVEYTIVSIKEVSSMDQETLSSQMEQDTSEQETIRRENWRRCVKMGWIRMPIPLSQKTHS